MPGASLRHPPRYLDAAALGLDAAVAGTLVGQVALTAGRAGGTGAVSSAHILGGTLCLDTAVTGALIRQIGLAAGIANIA